MFNTISAYRCGYSCQYCCDIKQKYCIFVSPKAHCVQARIRWGKGVPAPSLWLSLIFEGFPFLPLFFVGLVT